MDQNAELCPDQDLWLFHRAVLLLVEGESYLADQPRLARIAPSGQSAFLALLRAGTPLTECFGELTRFGAWQRVTLPILVQQGIAPGSPAQQVALYLLMQSLPPAW